MATTISDIYKKAIDNGVLSNKVSEERFAQMLQNEQERKAYWEFANKQKPNFYSSDYDVFSKNASALFATTEQPKNQPIAQQTEPQNPSVKDNPAPTTEKEYQEKLAIQNEYATPLPEGTVTPAMKNKQPQKSLWQRFGEFAYRQAESQPEVQIAKQQMEQDAQQRIKQEQERAAEEARQKEVAQQIEKRRPMFEQQWNGTEDKEGDVARLDKVMQAATEKANAAAGKVADEYADAYRYSGMMGGSRLAMGLEVKRAYNKEASPDVIMNAFTQSLDEDYQSALNKLTQQTGGDVPNEVSRPMTEQELAAMYQKAGIMSPEDYEWYRQYVQGKLQEKFAAMNVPKNKMDYFVNKFMQSNLIGQLATLYTSTPYQRAAQMQGVDTYEQEHDDFGTKAVGFGADVAGLLADPTMLVMPMVGSTVGGAVVRGIAGNALGKIGYASAQDIAARAMMQRGILQTANRLAGSAFTFAGIDATHDVVNQLYQPVYNEETGQYENGDWQPWQTAKAAAKGAITGTIFGGAGLLGDRAQHVIGEAWNKTAGLIAGKATHFVGGTNAMVGTSVVSQILQGRDVSDINWGEEYANAAAMQLVFDIQGGVRNLGKVYRNAAESGKPISLPEVFKLNWQRMKADPYAGSFTQEEIEQFNKAGYRGKDGYEILLNMNGGKEYKTLNELYTVLDRIAEDPTIDTQAKYRLASLIYGKTDANVRPVMTDSYQDEQGRYVVRTYDNAGQTYETRYFNSEQKAQDFRNERRNETQGNLKEWQEGVIKNYFFATEMQRVADAAVDEIQKQYPQYTREQLYNIMRESMLNPHTDKGKAIAQDGEASAIRSMFEEYLSANRPQSLDVLGVIRQNTADNFGITLEDVRNITSKDYRDLDMRERGIYDDYVSRLSDAMPRPQKAAETQQTTEPQPPQGGAGTGVQALPETIRKETAAEVEPNINKDDGNVYAVTRADDETKRGYVVSGKVEIDGTDPNAPRISNNDVVTVRYEDGTVEQLSARDLNLATTPTPAADVIQNITDERVATAQVAEQVAQTFRAGQEVTMDDGSGNTYTSHVVSVSTDGVEVEIENAQGEPDTTIIPNEIALTALHPVEQRQRQPEQQVEKQEPFEFVKTDPFGNPIVVEQPEQIPTTPQKIVPNIDTMLADELGASVVEYLGDKASAIAYLEAERDKADDDVKRLAKQKVTRYTDIADFKRQNDELQTAKKAAADRYNKLQNAIAIANNYKTQAEQAEEAARKAREEEKRAARRQTQIAQLSNTAPAERWQSAPKAEGNEVTRTLPDGTVIKGHYVLVEAGAATPSHDPFNSWNTSNGFPVTEDGKNINDRDYKNDTDAQQITTQIAQTYDGQAVAQVPVVSSEGIVYDGNGRTIAGNIAAANNTDGAYIQALADNAGNFGFAPEQVAGMQHPRVYMQTDEDLPYNTTTFAKFNAQEKKSQGSTNRAVSSSKKLTDAARDGMLRILDDYGTLDAFFASENGAKDIVRSLLDNGIITQQEVAGLTENTDRGFVLSPAGKDYVTDLLIGGLFDEQTIRMLGNDKGLKQSILRAMPSIVENRRLGDYALTDNINNAIRLLYEARQAGAAYPLYIRQVDAFEGKVSDRFSPFEMLLAEEMSSGVEDFRQVLNLYNNSARDDANGQTGLFEPRTFDDIKKEILQHYGRSTDQSAATAAESTQSRPANTQTEPPVPSTPTGDGQGEVANLPNASQIAEEVNQINNTRMSIDDSRVSNEQLAELQALYTAWRSGTEENQSENYTRLKDKVTELSNQQYYTMRDMDELTARIDEELGGRADRKSGYAAVQHLLTSNPELGREFLRQNNINKVEELKEWCAKRQYKLRVGKGKEAREAAAQANVDAILGMAHRAAEESTQQEPQAAESAEQNQQSNSAKAPKDEQSKDNGGKEQSQSQQSENKIFTEDAYEAARRRMHERLKRLNAGLDPEMLSDGLIMAGYHVEKGARKFAEFAREMIREFGDKIRPYLKSFYNGLRDLPEAVDLSKEMDDYSTVMQFDVNSISIERAKETKKTSDILPSAGESVTLQPKKVDVEGLFGALNTKGEAKLSDHIEQESLSSANAEDTQPIGNVIQSKHTKTGEDIWIVKPSERVSDDEFKLLKARAKANNGYYSSFAKNRGFIFKSKEDANNFNNISDEEITTDQTSADTETAVRTAETVVGETATITRDRRDSNRAEGEPGTESIEGGVREPRNVELTPEQANEQVTTRQQAIAKIDNANDKTTDQLAVLGFYEADTSDPTKLHESYGYIKTAEAKAVKDIDRLAKQLADDLGIKVSKRKTIAKANIAPAGGNISFRLPLENGKELYLSVDIEPNFNDYYRADGDANSLVADHMFWRIEDPQANGTSRYLTSNQNYGLFERGQVTTTYADLLRDIRRMGRDYLSAIPTGTTKQEIAKQIAEKTTRKKKDTTRIADTQSMLDLFGDVAETMNEGAQQEQDGWNPQASTDEELQHGYNVGDKVPYQGKTAEIVGFDNGRLVLDLMGSGWNTKLARFDEIEHINTNNNGDTTEIRTDGRGENGTAQTEPTRQSRDENGTLGGSEQPQDERPVGRRVDTGSKPHRVHDGERSAGTPVQPTEQTVTQSEQTDIEPSQWRNTHNFHARGGERLSPTAPKARYEANLAAIRLLKQLQDEGRQATAQEKDILAQYSGWGGLGEFFKGEPGTTYYSQQGEQSPYQVLQSLLTDEELQAAQLSRNSAYYTPESVINSMWQVAERLGFKGGNILEGSAGIGNIFALMPSDISHRSNLTAVEIDDITAGILSQLYPDATTYHAGFQDVDIPNNSQDLVITNVPFVTGLHVYDKQEKDLSKRFGNIHDFCIAKNVRKLKQGGLGIFISSSGTLDNSKDLRVWLNNEGDADVIGAFRLNRETFGGTSATSDIIVVRKRVNGQKDPRSIDVLDTATDRIAKQPQDEVFDKYTNQFKKPADKEIKLVYNKYFVEHPLSMGGEMGFGFEHGDTRWGGTTAGCYPEPTINQSARLKDWIDSIEQSEQLPTYDELKQGAQVPNGTYETYEGAVPYGSLILNSKGEICKAYHGTAVPVEGINSNKVKGYSKSQVLKDYNAIKQAIDNLLQAQTKNVSDSELKPYLQQLNKVYDDFVRKYGNLNRNTSLAFLRNDVQWASVAAIEKVKETVDVNGKKKIQVAKTDLFSKRVVGVQAVPKAENTRDGIILSMQQFGTIRPDKIAEWLSKPTDEVEKEIIGTRLGFRDPQTGNIQVRYEYLSGNVREKLAYAMEHNENGSLDANIEELRKVIPIDIPAHLIEFNIGSTWIPKELYLQYAKEKYDLDNLKLNHVGSAWVSNDVWGRNEKNRSEGVYSDMLGIQIYGHELMLAAMNNVPVVVSRVEKHSDGTSETRTDKVASAACSDKISQIKDDFVDWARGKMQQDSELADRIQKIYNDRFNAIVPMLKVDKEFLSEHLPGQNSAKYTLYPHQQQAVARGLTQALMLAHEVGTGKTISLISTAMEMRCLGTAKKPMIVVQNATTQQFVADAKDLYPNAKILTVSDRDRTAEGRQEFYAKIKYNDWDLIIVPQSVFDMIPDSEARMRDFINEKIEEKMHAIEAAKEAGLDNNVTKRMERELGMLQEDLETNNMSGKRSGKKAKEKDAKKEAEQRANTEARAQAMLDRKTDDIENFDEMGIDALLIDEAHNYKHLGFATMMTRGVKGVDPSYSKRAAALYLKCQSIYERNGHKNVIFATGTPISNTAAEIWTFMKYLMPKQTLQENEIYYFDDFVHNFGKINEQLEFATNGKFKANNRFAQYGNVPELMRLWLSVADCTLTREVGQVNDKVPELEGGKAQDIFLPQSPSLIDIMSAVRSQLEMFEKMSGKEKRENSYIPLTMYGIAKRAAIDPRLVDANAVDEPLSKTNRAVEEILRSLNDSKKYKGTVAIFCDSYQNKQSGFNLFNDIKEKLTKQGVSANQIAIIRSEMSDSAKQKIFDAVREGDIRVIMGSTQTLGTGVNIQTRLHTLIHMDAPDRPMDYTQRNGRILRQGNMHKEWGVPVRVLRFGVEDSLDVTSYQRLKTKAGFIDSVMNGKSMIENNLENRVLEDVDEGIFDNPVAMLSGSQYALLKSQAERDLRKWSARAQQYRIDQILIAKKTKDNEKIIAYRKQKIADNEKLIELLSQTFPGGKVSEYNINGTVCHTAEEVKNALKEVNKDVTTESDALRKDVYGSKKALSYPITLNGVPFNVDVQLTRKVSYKDGQSIVSIEKEVLYSAPTLGIEPIASPTKVIDRLIDMIQDDIISGKQARDENAYSADYIKRLEKENVLMREREGKPFEHQVELEKAQTLVDEYTKKMQAELAEKEAKYANQSHNSVNLDKMDSEDDTTDAPEAQYDELDYDTDNLTDAQQLATGTGLFALDNAGIAVERVSEEQAEREVSAQKKSLDDTATWSELMVRANKAADITSNDNAKVLQKIETAKRKLETATWREDNLHTKNAADVSSLDDAKVRQKIDISKQKLENQSTKSIKNPVSFISDILELRQTGSSYYGTFKLQDGSFITLRLSNHNATVSNFDNEGETEGVSIVISAHPSEGIRNDGTAHVVEYFYRKKDLWNAYGTPLADILGDISELLRTGEYKDTTGLAQRQEVNIPAELQSAEFSIRQTPAPKNTGIGYKVFYRGKDGKLYPPMVANPNGADTPIGVWLNADAAPISGESKTGRPQVKAGGKGTQGGSGQLAYRPGWHLGEIPYALQFNRKDENGDKTLFPKDFVWAEVEYAADVNYQQEAEKEGITENGKYRHSYVGLKHLPTDGYYRYRTNPNPETDPWIITGAMKVNRVLTNEEVDDLVRKAGREPQQREFLRTSNGTICGYAKDGKIYLTDRGLNPNTPIHEYTHLWVKAVRNNNAELYDNLRDLFSRENLPDMWDELDNDPQYRDLSDEAKLSEIIARFSGKRGAERMEQEAQKLIDDAKQQGKRAVANAISLYERMRNLLRRFWNWVGEHLFHIKHFGSREEAADRVLYDLLNATDLHQPPAEKDSQAEFSIQSAGESAEPTSRLTRSEVVTKILVQNAKNDYNTMQAALNKVSQDIKGIRAAMRLQSGYDRNVVSALLNLYNTLLQSNNVWAGYMPDTTQRVAAQIVNAIGKQDINKEVNTIMDYIVDAQTKAAQRQWDKLRQTPIDKINISGVVAQGKVALQGQYALKALNNALESKLTASQLEEMIGSAMANEENATDESLRTQYKGKWIGYSIAQQHMERIGHLKQERQQLLDELDAKRSDKSLKPAARQQVVDNIKEMLRDNNTEQTNAYIQSARDLQDYIAEQGKRAKGFIEKQNANREKIRDFAAKDLAGVATNPNRLRTKRSVARSIWDAFASPIRDLQSMLRLCGMHAPDGEGYLYNHFMRNWMDGADRERQGIVEASQTLDNKIADLTHGKYKTWEEAARKINNASHNKFSVTMLNGVDKDGNPVNEEISLNAGNALYIYAVNKMADGKMKLAAMNITDADVEKLTNDVREKFGQEIIGVVDWIQSEYFSQLRNRYNPIHEDLFGAPMDAIENYFPLRINANARQKNEDLGDPDTEAARLLTGTSTGAIKRRTRNTLPLDVRNADFFSEVIRHIAQMERWSAFAQWTRDANILFSDIDFRNRIKGMDGTIYGSGEQLYNYMKDAFRVAVGTYKPNTDTFSEFALNAAKGVTSAKINFRLFTAIKQLASFPAFFTYMTDGVFVKSYMRNWLKPHETTKWAKETLPNFEKRVSKRDMGDMRLMQRSTDWQWNKRILEISSKYGMAANVLFDTLTCATGARAVYDSRYAEYKQKGYTEEEAANRARQDAEMAFNTSQQSSEGAFMAPIQLDRNLATAALTVFRTSNFQYTRNLFYNIRNLKNKLGQKEEMIASRKQQYIADGLTEEQAQRAAEHDWSRSNHSDIIGIVVYGALLNLLWRLFGNFPYLIFGDDNDKKSEIAKKSVTGGAFVSPVTGLLGGGIVEQALDGYGDVSNMFAPELPFTQDVKKAMSSLKNDQYAEFTSQALSVLMQSGAGFDPQTAADMIARTVTTLDSEQDLDAAKQALRVLQAVLSIPQSQYEQMLIDEVIDNRRDYRDALADYKRYISIHKAPLTWYMRSDESENKTDKSAETRFKKLYNERKELRN
jgi:N12 class adenine-specific DNA methylase